MNKTTTPTPHRLMTTGVLTIAALVLLAGPAMARPFGGPGGNFHKGRRLEMMKERLGLSDAQVAQIKAIYADGRARTQDQRVQVRALHQQMKTLLQADVIDEAQVVAVHNQLKALKRVLGEERFQGRLKVMRLLSKEQRVKMMQMKGKRRGFKRGFMRGPAPQVGD